MPPEELHITAEIKDGIEELWVTSETSRILLRIAIATGEVRNFSCKLAAGRVAEMGPARDVKTGHLYPSLHIYTEDADHNVTLRKDIGKRQGEWFIGD